MELVAIFITTIILGTFLIPYCSYINSRALAFKPSEAGRSTTDLASTTSIPSMTGKSNLTSTPQQGVSTNQTRSSSLNFIQTLPSGQLLVQFPNGTKVQVPNTVTFLNGTTVDTISCIDSVLTYADLDYAVYFCSHP
jgi:hypothetical protein